MRRFGKLHWIAFAVILSISLIVFCVLFSGWSYHRNQQQLGASPPLPSPHQSLPPKGKNLSLDELLVKYKELGLPLPPPNAKLVRFESGTRTVAGNGSWKKHFALGFLLQPANNTGSKKVLVGTQECLPFYATSLQEIDPQANSFPEVSAQYHQLNFPMNAGLATAIQCKAFGWNDFAQKLLESSEHEFAAREGSIDDQPLGLTNEYALAYLAWSHWCNELSKAGTDRIAIAKRLDTLVATTPLLATQCNRALLKDLQTSIIPSKAISGSPASILDGLVEYAGFDRSTQVDLRDQIIELGFDAIPILIDHLDDQRLTRHFIGRFNNAPPRFERVSEIASELLRHIADADLLSDRSRGLFDVEVTKEVARSWWNKAQKEGEQAYLMRVVLPAHERWPSTLILKIIKKKYPEDLIKIYTTILDEKTTAESKTVVEMLVDSTVPTSKKIELLKRGATHYNEKIRETALQQLKVLESRP